MDLQIQQDEAFQRREWRFERLGWALLTLFVVAGLLGVLGKGPVAWSTVGDGDVVQVEHNRITHLEADDTVLLRFGPDAVEDDTVTVELTGTWVSAVDLRSVSPAPSEESLTPGGVVMEFAVDTVGRDLAVQLGFRAQGIGSYTGHARVGDAAVSFRQTVLP